MQTGGGPWRSALGERGAVAIQTALVLVLFLGMAALGSEVSLLLLKQRQMQTAADAAAMAGAAAIGGTQAQITIEADAMASVHSFTPGANGTTVTVNNPPLGGPRAGDAAAVEVIIDQPQQLYLTRLFHPADIDVKARAVATHTGSGGGCILSLDPSASGGIYISNNARVSNPGCGLLANSSSSSALVVTNNAIVTGPVMLHGGYSLSNNAQLTGSPVITYGAVTPDPYSAVAVPAAPACTAQSGNISGTASLTPGHFCSGFNFSNNARITLNPGVYYIDSKFSAQNGVIINANGGVTIIINGNYAMSLGNGAIVNITAPAGGATAGMAIRSLSNAKSNITQTFENNASLNIVGAIYFPTQTVKFTNNGTTTATICTQLIARIIHFDNNVGFNNNCSTVGVLPIGGASGAKLVE